MIKVSIHKTIFITNGEGDTIEIFICDDGYLKIKCPDGKVFETMEGRELIDDLDNRF